MVKMINRLFGTTMWVAENRVEEYKAAGHRLAAEPPKPAEPTMEPEPQEPKERKRKKR